MQTVMNDYTRRMMMKKMKKRREMRNLETPEKEGHAKAGAGKSGIAAKNRIV